MPKIEELYTSSKTTVARLGVILILAYTSFALVGASYYSAMVTSRTDRKRAVAWSETISGIASRYLGYVNRKTMLQHVFFESNFVTELKTSDIDFKVVISTDGKSAEIRPQINPASIYSSTVEPEISTNKKLFFEVEKISTAVSDILGSNATNDTRYSEWKRKKAELSDLEAFKAPKDEDYYLNSALYILSKEGQPFLLRWILFEIDPFRQIESARPGLNSYQIMPELLSKTRDNIVLQNAYAAALLQPSPQKAYEAIIPVLLKNFENIGSEIQGSPDTVVPSVNLRVGMGFLLGLSGPIIAGLFALFAINFDAYRGQELQFRKWERYEGFPLFGGDPDPLKRAGNSAREIPGRFLWGVFLATPGAIISLAVITRFNFMDLGDGASLYVLGRHADLSTLLDFINIFSLFFVLYFVVQIINFGKNPDPGEFRRGSMVIFSFIFCFAAFLLIPIQTKHEYIYEESIFVARINWRSYGTLVSAFYVLTWLYFVLIHWIRNRRHFIGVMIIFSHILPLLAFV